MVGEIIVNLIIQKNVYDSVACRKQHTKLDVIYSLHVFSILDSVHYIHTYTPTHPHIYVCVYIYICVCFLIFVFGY